MRTCECGTMPEAAKKHPENYEEHVIEEVVTMLFGDEPNFRKVDVLMRQHVWLPKKMGK